MEDEEDEERLLQLSIGTGLCPSHFLHSPHSAFPPRFCLTRMWQRRHWLRASHTLLSQHSAFPTRSVRDQVYLCDQVYR